MADTPEEVAFDVFASSDTERAKRIIVAAITAAEARGFAKGLEAAEAAVMAPWDDLGDRPSSSPAALYNACARIRALAPEAPPEVAAAEPKP